MSDLNSVQDQNDSGTDAIEEDSGQGSETIDYSQSQFSPFLNTVDEAHREVVGPYLQKWDGLTTRRFQELQSQYQPYRELGDFEVVQRAKQIYDTLESDPEHFFQILSEQLGYQFEDDEQAVGEVDQPAGSLPPEFVTEYEQMKELVQQLGQQVIGSQQQQVAAQEDAALEDWLVDRQEAYGDFDVDYVVTKMFNGMDGDDAIRQFLSLTQSQVNQAMGAASNLPPTLSGGGAIPNDDTEITKASPGQIKNLVAELMKQSAQNSG